MGHITPLAAVLPRVHRDIGFAAEQPDAPADAGAVEPAADTYTDPQGRIWRRSVDPSTGHLQWTHENSTRAADGTMATVKVVIDVAADGSSSRNTTQTVRAANGDRRDVVSTLALNAAGMPLTQDTHTLVVIGSRTQDETTHEDFTAGSVTRRATQLVDRNEQVDPATNTTITSSQTIGAVWDEGGRPITETSIPTLTVDEKVQYTAPGMGINKDTDRIITTERSGAGTSRAISWSSPMKLTVRWNGHGNEYVERELSVPLDAAGQADMNRATTVREDNKESTFNKGVMQTRIWGGFASQLVGYAGIRMLGTAAHKLGRGLVWGGVGLGAATIAAEGQALLSKRNDASGWRLPMLAFDTGWLALVGIVTRGWGGMTAARQGQIATGSKVAGTVGLGAEGAVLAQRLMSGTRQPTEVENGDLIPTGIDAPSALEFAQSRFDDPALTLPELDNVGL